MSERHFHGQAHWRFDLQIDEKTLDDNANYWLSGARGAYKRLVNAVGEEAADKMATERDAGETWKSVCMRYEILADLAERQMKSKAYDPDLVYKDLKDTQEAARV